MLPTLLTIHGCYKSPDPLVKGHQLWRIVQWLCQHSKGARSFRGQNPQARSPGVRGVARMLHWGHRSWVLRGYRRSQDFLWGALFPQKSWPFLVVAFKTQAANAADCFTVKIKRSDMVTFLSFVHTITKAISRAADFPARSFDLARRGVAPPQDAGSRTCI